MDTEKKLSFKELARIKCSRWLSEQDCTVGEYDNEGFVIVPGWDVVNNPAFSCIVDKAVGSEHNYGFDDEYDTCYECGKILRTSPDSYSWQPEYWLSDFDGFLCVDCTANDYIESYLEYVVDHTNGPRHVNESILDLDGAGFKQVLKNCEYGMHRGQNEDPRKVAQWALENNLEIAFTVSTGQFDVSWDAWMRKTGSDYVNVYEPDPSVVLSDDEVNEIRASLVAQEYGYSDSLKSEFRQWPDQATVISEQLKQLGDARFATVGGENGPVVYGSIEEMGEALR